MNKLSALILSSAAIGVLAGCSANASSDEQPEKITLDYAYYSPTSLVLKEQGLVEEALKDEGIEVEWVLSQGSNKALEFLNSRSVDFGSTAGAAALIAKSNGSPVESVYLYAKPEWTALVAAEGSDIQSVEDLKGKKVAATLGTDPYIFLLRALEEAGVSSDEVEIVNLQHPDGANALSSGQVDAWAGLDPHMARAELDTNAELFYRNPDFNTYGTLNVRSEFAEDYPEIVEEVIAQYEAAREWTIANPDDAAQILADEAEMNLEVAKASLARNDFSNPVIGDEHTEALIAAGEVLRQEEVIDQDADIEALVDELLNPSFTESLE
ncbi:aliphatic sulfonate ABC transporter substrate-binding protein [Jeotgalibacillus haloalkalitolerans]|uniref:Aliphatic sulfonate ABC transporter substrate-binding protein n=1 Tax=Jeotgalibacillus haloalkalitolerans TaxID=3104292 RepID=A0ABU5KPT7_9BACL|nr:aliphatic sulfonate ABC transporter substrate-binding protein [Jeotgalibacillus sp. HH7-29]MDZ5713254.1 aliphatic sulfonate ABC transporter substrate-binding protein [Jeotgalibacillus sp. HH7-29]